MFISLTFSIKYYRTRTEGLPEDQIADPIYNLLRKISIDGQAKHTIGNVPSHRSRCRIKAGSSPVAVKCVGERIKIFARYDVLRREKIKYPVACVAVSVKHYREIGIIKPDIRRDGVELNAGDPLEAGHVLTIDFFSLLDLPVEMPQIADAHGGTEFIHFGIASNVRHTFRPVDAEIFQIVQFCFESIVPVTDGSSFNGVKDFCCVEGEHGRIPEVCRTDAVFRHPKGVRGIIDHLEVVLFCKSTDGLYIAEIAVNMNGENGDRTIRDQRFDLRYVDRVVHRSMSQKTGVHPQRTMACVVEAKVNGVVMTSP